MNTRRLGPLTLRQRLFWSFAIALAIVAFVVLAIATYPFFVPCNGQC